MNWRAPRSCRRSWTRNAMRNAAVVFPLPVPVFTTTSPLRRFALRTSCRYASDSLESRSSCGPFAALSLPPSVEAARPRIRTALDVAPRRRGRQPRCGPFVSESGSRHMPRCIASIRRSAMSRRAHGLLCSKNSVIASSSRYASATCSYCSYCQSCLATRGSVENTGAAANALPQPGGTHAAHCRASGAVRIRASRPIVVSVPNDRTTPHRNAEAAIARRPSRRQRGGCIDVPTG